MRTTVRLLTFGALGGILLSVLRAPLGLDLLTANAVEGTTTLAFRAAALFTLGLAVANARMLRGGVRPQLLILSLGLGYGLHGLWLESWTPLGTRFEFALALVGIFVAMFLAGRVEPEQTQGEAEEAAEPSAPSLLEQLGLVLAGAAVAIALETTARPLRQLGLGLPADDTAFGIGLFSFVLLGAAAFGRFLPSGSSRRTATALALGASALLCILSLNKLSEFEDTKLLGGFIGNFGSLFIFDEGTPTALRVDVSHIGTWRVDLLLAGSALLVPSLALGAGLFAARSSKTWASLLVGASIGTLASALIIANSSDALSFEQLADSAQAAGRLTIATYLAAAGTLFVALGSGSAGTRSIGIAGALLFAVAPSFAAPRDPWLFSAWPQTPSVEPTVTIDSAEGLLTLEDLRGSLVATLERDRLTPMPTEEEADASRIRRSLDLLAPRDGSERVLFVGQLTPPRAETLRRAGVTQLERTAAWHRHMPALDEVLFRGSSEAPMGEVVALTEARERLANGDYDLVIVPPNMGRRLPTLPAQWDSAPSRMPRSTSWSVPEGTTAVVWLDTASELGSTDLGEHVLVSTEPFTEPCIGVVLGARHGGAGLAPGARRASAPSALSVLRLRGYQRQHRSRARLFERLRLAAAGTEYETWMTTLALHYGEQSEISPFGSWDQGIITTPEMLSALRETCLAEGELTQERRTFAEQVAKTLRTVRSPDLILEFIEPIAKHHGPWFELDYAVLKAYMEFDMEAEVTAQLPALLSERIYDLDLLLLTAVWYRDHGEDQTALEYLTRAQEAQPGRGDVVRPAAFLAHELGDASAEVWLERALEFDPDDGEIRELLSGYRD